MNIHEAVVVANRGICLL